MLHEKQSMSSLMYASSEGHTEAVKLLLDHDPQVDMQDNEGWSALMHASLHGHVEVVKLLLDSGAEIHIQDKSGRSALMHASYNGHIEVTKVLIAHGADVYQGNFCGKDEFQLQNEKIVRCSPYLCLSVNNIVFFLFFSFLLFSSQSMESCVSEF